MEISQQTFTFTRYQFLRFSLFLILVSFFLGGFLGSKFGLSQCYPYAVPHDVAIQGSSQ